MSSVPDPPLPDLHQATLSDDELAALLRDLAACAEVLSIRVRGAPPGSAPTLALGDVQSSLASGAAAAVQITYRFDGATWIDTLTGGDGATRLVRIRAA